MPAVDKRSQPASPAFAGQRGNGSGFVQKIRSYDGSGVNGYKRVDVW